jgi:hypothetical protein
LQSWWQSEQANAAILLPWLESVPQLGDSYHRLVNAARERVAAALELWTDAPLTLVHGDLLFDNIIVGDRGTTLLDWEESGLGDPAWEVATLLHGNPFISDAAREEWLESYLAGTDLPNLAQRIETYRMLYPFHWLNYLLVELRPDGDILRGLDVQVQMEFAHLITQVHTEAMQLLDSPSVDNAQHFRTLFAPSPPSEVKP